MSTPAHAPSRALPRLGFLALFVLTFDAAAARGDDGWIDLSGLDAWKGGGTGWKVVGDATLDAKNPRRLTPVQGGGVLFNGDGVAGRAGNLVSRSGYGDVEVHLEFNVPKGSNSGVKLEGVYEIQIFDSFGAKDRKAEHAGGIYPRAELLPRYHHIDEGYPPKVNACKPPGTWQTLDIVFHSPRFDASGKKTADARFVSVTLNGRVVQEDLDVPCPTGNNWRNKETPTGPILLQGDHGTVAFRNVRVRPRN